MLRIFIIFTCLLFNIVTIEAQSQKSFSVSGVLIDKDILLPVEFASVAVCKLPDSSVIGGVISNQKGAFEIANLKQGDYFLRISFIGYQTHFQSFTIVNEDIKWKSPILLKPSHTLLSGVDVEASKVDKQVTIEMTKINVSENIGSVSGNITDVLKTHAAITIDQDNSVYIRGNGNILILLDGVPTTAATLNAIPSSNVESVEIITNPDSKYDSEGTAGIINVISKREKKSGFSASSTINYGFQNRFNGGVNLNYNIKKWNVGFNYNGKYDEVATNSRLTRDLLNPNLEVKQVVNSVQKNPVHNIGLHFCYKPNKLNTIDFNAKYVLLKINNLQEIFGEQIGIGIADTIYQRLNDVTHSRKIFETSLSFKRQLKPQKSEISSEIAFSRTKGSRPAKYYIENEFLQKAHGGGAPTNATWQVDFFKVFNRQSKMEAGFKAFSRWNDFQYNFYDVNPMNEWILNPQFSNDLEHQEYVFGSYLMYSDSLFKKIFFKAGGRIEYNRSNFYQKTIQEEIFREYWFPFPFLLMKYQMDKKQQFSLSVNRRINRPKYPQINPFINVIDQMTYETGNKYLQPDILDKIEFNYSYITQKWQIKSTLYLSQTTDFITQISILSPPDKLIITYVNGDKQQTAGGDFDLGYNVSKYLNLQSSSSVFQTSTTDFYYGIDLSTNNLAWTSNFKIQIKPDVKTDFQIVFNYHSPIDLPQFRVGEICYTDLSIRRMLIKNKLSVSLTLTDVFDTRNWEVTAKNSVYKFYNYSKMESRILWLGVTYNFNSYTARKQAKPADSESEKGVIRIGQQ